MTADHRHIMPPGVPGFPNGICLARLRLDGFVSVDGGAEQGTLTTKSIVATGSELEINADARAGRVVAELLNADGKPIDGFTKQDCDDLRADKIRHTVTWHGKKHLDVLTGKTIKLKFYLRQAKLYSFRFRE